jgi:hypothetical protein
MLIAIVDDGHILIPSLDSSVDQTLTTVLTEPNAICIALTDHSNIALVVVYDNILQSSHSHALVYVPSGSHQNKHALTNGADASTLAIDDDGQIGIAILNSSPKPLLSKLTTTVKLTGSEKMINFVNIKLNP